MLQRRWYLIFPQAVLIGGLSLYGCNSEQSGGPAPQSQENAAGKTEHKEVGMASWYGAGLQGQETSNGETFDSKKLTAAHPSLPMGTKAEVTNLDNGKKVEVKINDRGPFIKNRAIDLSAGAAKKLDMKRDGVVKVKIETKTKAKTKTKTAKNKRHPRAKVKPDFRPK